MPSGDRIFSYDILTNPFDCKVGWEPKTNRDLEKTGFFQIKVGATPESTDSKYVGRVEYFEDSDSETLGQLLIGQVNENQKLTYIVDQDLKNETKVEESQDYWVLVSYSDGFDLEFEDFKMNDTMYASVDMLGMDELHNMADTDAGLTVVHKNTVVKSTKFGFSTKLSLFLKVSSSFKFSGSLWPIVSGSASIPGPDFLNFELGLSVGIEGGVERTKEETLEITRQISVGPYTSVQVIVDIWIPNLRFFCVVN